MKIKKLIEMECDAKFVGLTLLSEKEYTENREFIKLLNNLWWLRSPCYYSRSHASCVCGHGGLGYNDIDDTNSSVRPALILNSESSFIVGDKFKYYDHNWTVISAKYALCDEEFCRMTFRKCWTADDANDYEVSDIKRYLDSEWDKMMDDDSNATD